MSIFLTLLVILSMPWIKLQIIIFWFEVRLKIEDVDLS